MAKRTNKNQSNIDDQIVKQINKYSTKNAIGKQEELKKSEELKRKAYLKAKQEQLPISNNTIEYYHNLYN